MFKALGVVVERLEKVEKSLDGRPRSASKAAETAIDDDGTDAFKGLLKRLEKGAEGEKTFLGFEVAEEPK